MNKRIDAYLFGQILGTHSFLLKGGFLQPDEYSEIQEQYFLPGGETGTAATVLNSLGMSVRMDGTWIGTEVAPMLKEFYKNKKVDLSALTFTEDAGVMDYVVISGLVRSPMGRFQQLFSSSKRFWNSPKEEDIAGCTAAAIDPFFGDDSLKAAQICKKLNIPYVTIDSPHDSPLHKMAAVNVVSKECTGQHYKGMQAEEIMKKLQAESDGLTIITQGGGEMLYGRKGGEIKRMKPFPVEVKSTLGAGDTFKAACVYGLIMRMNDDDLVRFASACSGIAISRFPLPLNPPEWHEVELLLQSSSEAAEKLDFSDVIGRTVSGKIDRPLKSKHPRHPDMIYPINYGYVEGLIAGDGAEQDIYLFDCDQPVESYTGKVIAVYHRTNDVEDKWIVVPENSRYATNPSALSDDEILRQIEFQEKYFAGRLYR